jgi:hypothetical protein
MTLADFLEHVRWQMSTRLGELRALVKEQRRLEAALQALNDPGAVAAGAAPAPARSRRTRRRTRRRWSRSASVSRATPIKRPCFAPSRIAPARPAMKLTPNQLAYLKSAPRRRAPPSRTQRPRRGERGDPPHEVAARGQARVSASVGAATCSASWPSVRRTQRQSGSAVACTVMAAAPGRRTPLTMGRS